LLSVITALKYLLLVCVGIVLLFFFQATENKDVSIFTAILLLTAAFALFGVILPKIYGASHSLSTARNSGRICKFLILLVKPLVRPLLRTSIKVEKKLDSQTEEQSLNELTQALQLATVDNDPVEGEKEILEGIVNFGTLTVKQVMRPKHEISFTEVSLDFYELMDFVKRSGYSRIPVCRGSLDKVEGFLYIKDLLPFLSGERGFAWQKLLRPGYFVPETKKIDALLKDFQEKRVHMALVVNQNGNTTGLITLEDIIEEIIGDINDEFDEIGARYQKISDNTFVFDGKTSVHEFCKIVNVDPKIFHPVKGINESLGGMLVEVNQQLPVAGQQIVIDPFTFVIESVDHKRIKKIKVLVNETSKK
jgi:gliding motility-associated protein GldE